MKSEKIGLNDLEKALGGVDPKAKIGRRTKDRREAHGLKAVELEKCPQCHELKLPHRVCTNCGYYGGKDVMNMDLD